MVANAFTADEARETECELNTGHQWHERVFASMQIKCCMLCGFIKNEKQPNKPCPGFVAVEVRSSPADEGGKK